jgi:hypothetical protein
MNRKPGGPKRAVSDADFVPKPKVVRQARTVTDFARDYVTEVFSADRTLYEYDELSAVSSHAKSGNMKKPPSL